MRESFEVQIKKIEGLLDIKESISSQYSDWSKLLEIFERRNLFAHANGHINQIYLKNAERNKYPNSGKLILGQELYVSPKYFKSSLETMTEFGVNLIQVMWRKSTKGEEAAADDAYGSFGYELIVRGEYKLAAKILVTALSLRGKMDESRRRMNKINLANCYNLLKDEKKRDDTLSQDDWTVVNDAFKISLAAVKSDIAEVIRLIKKIPEDDEYITATSLEEWPVFYSVRDSEDFKEAFKEKFQREFAPAPTKRNLVFSALNTLRTQEVATPKPSSATTGEQSSETFH